MMMFRRLHESRKGWKRQEIVDFDQNVQFRIVQTKFQFFKLQTPDSSTYPTEKQIS